jgi:hypothetical protein
MKAKSGGVFRAVDRWAYAAAPAARLAAVRLFVGAFAFAYLCVRFPSFTSVTRFSTAEFAPVGPLFFLETPVPSFALPLLVFAAIVLSLAFMLGVRYRITAPAFALVLLFITTYRSSFGMKFHTENLLVWHVLLLALSPAADALSVDARGRSAPEAHGRYGFPLRTLGALTAATYVLAGVAKLRLGGDAWLSGEILQVQIAYDNLRKIELGSFHSPVGVALVPHAGLFTLLAWLTLGVELGAPAALAGGRTALVWSVLAWGFHASVLALMMIAFAYPLSAVPYLAFFRVERLLEARPFRFVVRRFETAHATPVHKPPVPRSSGGD